MDAKKDRSSVRDTTRRVHGDARRLGERQRLDVGSARVSGALRRTDRSLSSGGPASACRRVLRPRSGSPPWRGSSGDLMRPPARSARTTFPTCEQVGLSTERRLTVNRTLRRCARAAARMTRISRASCAASGLLLRVAGESQMRKAARVACVLVAWSGFALVARGQGAIQLHNGGTWSNYTTVPSVIWTNPASDQEAADDINVNGTITRVVANGNGCFQCAPTALAGVWVRFYAWQSGIPGTLAVPGLRARRNSAAPVRPRDHRGDRHHRCRRRSSRPASTSSPSRRASSSPDIGHSGSATSTRRPAPPSSSATTCHRPRGAPGASLA